MNKLYRKLLKPLNLTYPQYLVLVVLWKYQQMSVSAIGERLYLDSATLTPLLKRMEALNLVIRTRSTLDERSVMVTLTEQGKQLEVASNDVLQQAVCASKLDWAQLQQTKDALDLLRHNLLKP